MFNRLMIVTTLALALGSTAYAGPYSAPSDDPDNPFDPPISKTDPRIVAWADTVVDYSPAPDVAEQFQNPVTGYGSLGDLTQQQIADGVSVGTITVGFSGAIRDGEAFDFAVYENGFGYGGPTSLFADLAYVEVSSDGTNFARFDAIATNTEPLAGSGAFSGWDTTNLYNLAGKHADGWGTPFDLGQLADHALVTTGLLDRNNVRFVRLVDIPGTGHFEDSLGNGILDVHPTTGSGGYDFRLTEGVAVLNAVPEPGTGALLGTAVLVLAGCAAGRGAQRIGSSQRRAKRWRQRTG